MDQAIRTALEKDRVIDITTTGRKSGQPRRIEIWFHNIGGRLFITGTPGRRDWYTNLLANPEMTFHLKESAQADIPATARPVHQEAARRWVLSRVFQRINRSTMELPLWIQGSPLVEVKLDLE